MYKHIETMLPQHCIRVIGLAGSAQRTGVYLRRRKQLPGCKGRGLRDLKLASLNLRLLK